MSTPGRRGGRGPGADAGELTASSEPELDLSEVRARLRESGRASIGVTGSEDVPSLRETFRASGVGIYPALALGLLVTVDQFQTAAMTLLGPEITSSLGIPRPAYAAVLVVRTLVVTVAALPIAALVQGRPRRAAVCIVTAFAWAALTILTGYVISIWGLLLIAALAGAATGSVRSIHQPLLLDSYPPQARMRVLSFYRGFDNVGDIVGPATIGLCTAVLGLTWRGAFAGLGVIAVTAAVIALRLRDPGYGRWDADPLRAAVRADVDRAIEGGTAAPAAPAAPPAAAGDDDDLGDGEVALGFFEIARRLLLIPTVRRMMMAWAVLGMMLAPFLTYLAFFLQEQWGMGTGARALFGAVMPTFGIIGLRLFSHRGEELFRRDPARLLELAGLLLGAAILAIAVALFVPVFLVMALLFGAGLAVITVISPAIALPMYSIVPPEMRPHLGALQGIFLAGVGGVAGLLLLGGIDSRFGATGAILSLAVPGVAGGLVLRTTARTVTADLDRMLDQVVEDEEIRVRRSRGVQLPLLSCRHVDFSYGQLQVLFDVDFTVDDGEIVALLGTNGAGKSTLLRVISGLGLPDRGSVRLHGRDITYVDAERRVHLGISQVPGGRAVFGPMSIVENLRVLAYTHGRDRRAVDAGIEASFQAFPRLAERRNQLASTLSGGEQQMLGLATAFIVRPRLLLIDELSLGLAPKIVAELLDMVRTINAAGTAVVLVEQSVNVALSVVSHAYFMEKGEIRFDGDAALLLERPDLLRSVFLEGATGRLGTDGDGRG